MPSPRSLRAPLVALALLFVTPPGFSANQPDILGADGAPMRLVPAGSFTMGSNEVEDEQPVHEVYLDAFYMDQLEVTTARYARFLLETGLKPPRHWTEVDLARDGDRPVVGMSWVMAANYCRWAGKRLPTEAEWEKAARGTDVRRYPWGDEEPTSERGNFGRMDWKGYGTLDPVGRHPRGASPYGIHDLAGNVAEWVSDWYNRAAYQTSPDRNPTGPAEGLEKVIRGGGWNSDPRPVRAPQPRRVGRPGQHDRLPLRERRVPTMMNAERRFQSSLIVLRSE